MRAFAFARLVRPANAALAGIGALAGAVGAVGRDLPPVPVAFSMAAAMLGVAGGNALNDALDAEIDRAAHPTRPIPRGEVGTRQARNLGLALIAAGVACALVSNGWTFMLATILAVTLLLYEYRAKSRGLLGHFLVGFNTGSLFLLGALAAVAGPFSVARLPADDRLVGPLGMSFLALLLSFARELYKAAEDAPHDEGHRRTFAVTAGPSAARQLGAATVWATALLAVAPVRIPGMGTTYLFLVAPLLLLLLAVPLFGSARRSRAGLKVAMWLGMVPFVVPKLI